MDKIRPDFAKLHATEVAHEPFDHLVVREFVPRDQLSSLLARMPAMKSGGSYPPEALTLDPLVAGLIETLEGPELRAAIAEKFALDLSDAPTMLTMRGQTRAKDGRIHCDSTAKRVTVLLYLNPAREAWEASEGCLRLLRGPFDIEDYAVEAPPVDGTLVVFPNGSTTWHGHKRYVGQRFTIQLNYMQTGAKARSELRRHRVSSFVKRLPLAG